MMDDDLSCRSLPSSLSAVVDAAPVMHNAAYRPSSTDARDAWEDVPSRIRRRRRWTWGGWSIEVTTVSFFSAAAGDAGPWMCVELDYLCLLHHHF